MPQRIGKAREPVPGLLPGLAIDLGPQARRRARRPSVARAWSPRRLTRPRRWIRAGSAADSVTSPSRSISAPTSMVWVATTYTGSLLSRPVPARIRGYQPRSRYSRSTGRIRPVSSTQRSDSGDVVLEPVEHGTGHGNSVGHDPGYPSGAAELPRPVRQGLRNRVTSGIFGGRDRDQMEPLVRRQTLRGYRVILVRTSDVVGVRAVLAGTSRHRHDDRRRASAGGFKLPDVIEGG